MILRNALVYCPKWRLSPTYFVSKGKQSEIIYEEEDRIVCDFQKLEIVNSRIDSLVVVNNQLNQ